MTGIRHKTKVKYLLLGFLVGVGMFILLGAKSQDDVVLLAADRYRVSAWGDPHSHGAFIIDSLTGSTKLVYQHYYENSEDKLSHGGHAPEDLERAPVSPATGTQQDHLGLPFSQVP